MRFTMMITTVLALTAAVGCSNPIDAIDERVDCRNICDRYRDCYDNDYDTEACRDRCDERVDGEGGDPNAADRCDGCLDDRSCVEATFSCVDECAGIIP